MARVDAATLCKWSACEMMQIWDPRNTTCVGRGEPSYTLRDGDKDESEDNQGGDSGSSVYAMVQAVLNSSGRAQSFMRKHKFK